MARSAGLPDSNTFARLRQLDLPQGDFAIFGSGPLIVRGVIEATNDLDVLCRGPAWDYVQTIGQPEYLSEYGLTIFAIDDGRITFGDRWAIGDFDTDTLIDSMEFFEGLPFVSLQYVLAYKILANRPKDRQHLQALRSSGYLD